MSESLKQFVLMLIALLAGTNNGAAQHSDSLLKISANLEIRPRLEYRSNFSPTANDRIQNEFSATQRNRFTISFFNGFL